MAVLYRKYRPQTFSQVLGQKAIVQTLKNQVKSGGVAHAYLFTGSRGVGKTSFARILAKAVNCTSENRKIGKSEVTPGDACGVCENCKAVEEGRFLDLVEIDAASNTGVDNIRDLIEHVKFAPAVGKYKVFIIDEVHMLSKGAFNALLKTLEEPPAHAIFILATTEINKVPATIISRSQRFDFHRYSQEELMEHLTFVAQQEKLTLSPEVIGLVAARAEGGVRDALSLLDKLSTLGSKPETADVQRLLGVVDIAQCHALLSHICSGNSKAIPEFFENLFSSGAEPSGFNRDFLEFLRKLLIMKVTGGGGDFSKEHEKEVEELLSSTTLQKIIHITKLFLKSYKDIPTSPNPEIPLLLSALEAVDKTEATGSSQTPKISSPRVTSDTQIHGKPSAVSEFAFTAVLEPSVALPSEPTPEEVTALLSTEVELSDIEKIWPELLEKLRSINGPLANLIRTSPIHEVKDGYVTMGVKYLFHKQNIENHKNAKAVAGVLQELLGKAVGVRARVIKPEVMETPDTTETLGDALKILGGELVE